VGRRVEAAAVDGERRSTAGARSDGSRAGRRATGRRRFADVPADADAGGCARNAGRAGFG
jgi:hypothetical protein